MKSPILATPPVAAAARPGVLQWAIRDKEALYAAYIPLFKDGGLFVPTAQEYRLGDDVYVLLALLQDAQCYPVAGTVAWVTPAHAGGGRTQGIGVRFPADAKSQELRARIEQILGAELGAGRPTQTI